MIRINCFSRASDGSLVVFDMVEPQPRWARKFFRRAMLLFRAGNVDLVTVCPRGAPIAELGRIVAERR
jgi:hypothetical protein